MFLNIKNCFIWTCSLYLLQYLKHLAFNAAKSGWNVVVSNHRGLGGVSITVSSSQWLKLYSCVNFHSRYCFLVALIINGCLTKNCALQKKKWHYKIGMNTNQTHIFGLVGTKILDFVDRCFWTFNMLFHISRGYWKWVKSATILVLMMMFMGNGKAFFFFWGGCIGGSLSLFARSQRKNFWTGKFVFLGVGR